MNLIKNLFFTKKKIKETGPTWRNATTHKKIFENIFFYERPNEAQGYLWQKILNLKLERHIVVVDFYLLVKLYGKFPTSHTKKENSI